MLHILKELARFHAVGFHVLGNSPEQFAEEHCPWIRNAGRLGQFMTDNAEVK